MTDPNCPQNVFGQNFDLYQHVDRDELNSALGELVVQGLMTMSNPASAMNGPTAGIPIEVLTTVAHANRIRSASPAPPPQQHPAETAVKLQCNWKNCSEVFDTPGKLRRHKDGHSTPNKECPLCPAGGRLWQRADHFQM
ncbi:hypothetical protein EDC01DRAFT_635849 [Geopyxis carbonaria]|nr:hypothetical protein EDC01DRAFT_635849 [Geopyxis carbonaria]